MFQKQGLYYDGNSGTYYYYDETSRTYQFHSQAQVAVNEASTDCQGKKEQKTRKANKVEIHSYLKFFYRKSITDENFCFQVLDDIHELINGLSNISIEKCRRQALGNYPMLLICTHVSLVG